ncbi:uncharacterized protein LOC134177221 isoform X2 [Corticium candelabrum]|uniref:uncharacterized protein LOC134177221 isoform X2 n=1 Tax=Corticium candelabrum TaxID=121492 RepID=UPI002E274E55|nr:uncharacterized protein LOC134177221 isoform X2 [Corticium candelabrum]
MRHMKTRKPLSCRAAVLARHFIAYESLSGAVGDPTRFGDCPFCMRVCMALTLKGVKFEMVYIDLSNKPQWFVELSKRGGGKGTTPVLVDGDKVLVDSGDIVEYLETTYPDKRSLRPVNPNANSAGADILAKFAAFVKNKDKEKDGNLRAELDASLKEFDSYLRQHGGPYIDGDCLTLPDCSILPRLSMVQIAGKHFKDYSIPADLSALQTYMKAGLNDETFKKCTCLPQDIIDGWKKHLG